MDETTDGDNDDRITKVSNKHNKEIMNILNLYNFPKLKELCVADLEGNGISSLVNVDVAWKYRKQIVILTHFYVFLRIVYAF